MTHDAAVKAIDGAIYRAEENLEEANQRAMDAEGNAKRAKAAWEKQREEADRRRGVASGYRGGARRAATFAGSTAGGGGVMPENEGPWAREYRQGRAEQVKQQRIANLIAISSVPYLAVDEQKQAARLALDLLICPGEQVGS